MKRFEGKVIKGARVSTVEVQAADREKAVRELSRRGQVVTVRRRATFEFGGGLTPPERQVFFARLSAMLSSRVGTSDALQLLRDTFTGRIRTVAGRLLGYVQAGADLPDAFEKVGAPHFDEATVALIKAGSRSGQTGKAIKDAAQFEQELHAIKKGASKGLWVGVMSFIGAGVMTLVSTLYVGPKIMESDLIKAANKNGAVNIDFVNNIAYAVGYLMGALLILGLLFAVLGTVGRQVAPVAADRAIMKIPYYKDLVLARNNFIVLYGLALLIKSGVRIEESLRLSAAGAPRGALRADLNAAMDAVRTGKPWPQAMKTLHPTDKAALLSATDREQIAATLSALADQYRELYGQRLASFVPALNLLAAMFLSIAGGLIFGQSILPMLQATQGLL